MHIRGGAWLLLLAGAVLGQTGNNQSLNGKYYFRHLLFTTDASETITDIRSLWGSITFDGSGHYSLAGQSAVGTTPPVSAASSGTYSVSPANFVTLTNPQNNTLTINGRLGMVAAASGQQATEMMVIGSSTEAAGNTFDLFIAIPAALGTADGSLLGDYYTATLAFPSGTASAVRSALFGLPANGKGGFADIGINGHGASIAGGSPTSQVLSGATYTMQADGSGSASFPLQSGLTDSTQLLSGNKTIYVSLSGSVVLGGSSDGTQQDILMGFKGGTGNTWANYFWQAGLRFESGGSASAFSGSLYSTGNGTVTLTRREHQLQSTGAVTYDFTGVNAYTLAATGIGTAELTNVAIGAAGNGFVGAAGNPSDPTGYELYLGVRRPTLSGNGVFLNPLGVVNAASSAPAGEPIAPGEFVALYGSNLAASSQVAAPPYPPSLGGVTVTINGATAPIYSVSAGQINALVPYATTGTTATIVVSNKESPSNAVQVAVAPTAPGVYSLDRSGFGPGAILHADFSLVDSSKPAKAGETVLVYLTGLGAVSPPVADGTAAGASQFSFAVAPVTVYIGGLPATVSYAGLAPLFPGLYQLNVVVPANLPVSAIGPFPLAVETPESFHDQVDLIVGP
ncbi:MAG: hypothetical protein LAP39_01530 [Acidobacteriia bacterium]|nr:hypothetical protein [Terriglobia bacterium]